MALTIPAALRIPIAHAIGLSEPVYAAWAGGSIHEVAQAVAAGFAFDQHAGVDASLYKLSRVAMLAPVCAVLAVWWRRRAGADQNAAEGKSGSPFPLFELILLPLLVPKLN